MHKVLDLFTVYHSPRDFPGEYAVRRFSIEGNEAKPGVLVALGPTLESVRRMIPAYANHRLPRSPQDEPQIVEVWL